MDILKTAIPFIMLCYLIILIPPILIKYRKKQIQQRLKKPPPPERPTNTSIIDWEAMNRNREQNPLNYTSYTHTLEPENASTTVAYTPSPGIVRWTSNLEMTDEQLMQTTNQILRDIKEKAQRDPVKLKTRFELLKE